MKRPQASTRKPFAKGSPRSSALLARQNHPYHPGHPPDHRDHQSHPLWQIIAGQLILVTGGLAAGILLTLDKEKILLVPGIFIIIPGFLHMRGEISASLFARIADYLSARKARPDIIEAEHSRLVRENMLGTLLLTCVGGMVIGLFAYFATWFVFGSREPVLLAISVLAALVSVLIESPLTLMGELSLPKKNRIPGKTLSSIIATTSDIISVVAILLALQVLA